MVLLMTKYLSYVCFFTVSDFSCSVQWSIIKINIMVNENFNSEICTSCPAKAAFVMLQLNYVFF
jgi:hypothetical protein